MSYEEDIHKWLLIWPNYDRGLEAGLPELAYA